MTSYGLAPVDDGLRCGLEVPGDAGVVLPLNVAAEELTARAEPTPPHRPPVSLLDRTCRR
ncbi:hypothetical protein [Streptomyces cavernicola]|uniref:Uncharacterized protein n=1 Tax=Streptomyces cavernicola TaxID=3043613 RepID=A0ABT6SGN4_9ACTN|nr:hypothetical protein [Streptomyces sp. B-S-A6]MDI3406436.1 hypothetical protein [Streptomyces sp. B-S-A6]